MGVAGILGPLEFINEGVYHTSAVQLSLFFCFVFHTFVNIKDPIEVHVKIHRQMYGKQKIRMGGF